MTDSAKSEYFSQEKMMELHKCISDLEKFEIQRNLENLSRDEAIEKCRKLIEQCEKHIGIIQKRQIKQASASLTNLIGYTPAELMDTPFARYVHHDELPKLAKIYEQRLSGNEVPNIYKTILKHKNGSDVHIEITAGLCNYFGEPATFAIIEGLSIVETI